MLTKVIIADDFTGACDAAAATGMATWVPRQETPPPHAVEVLVRNTETRNLSSWEARKRVRDALEKLPRPIAYWKMDSLLRGNWAHELTQAWVVGAVKRVMLAPAFPEQHRTTAGGVQYARGTAVGSVADKLLAAGFPPDGLRVVDALYSEDLRNAARSLQPDETPVGSAGLARALWGPRQVTPARAEGTILVVVGTASERGREQIEALRGLARVQLIAPGPRDSIAGELRNALRALPPAALIVVGGDTLTTVSEELSCDGLLVLGEVSPGVALAEIVGGPMHSRQAITKAGDFGERDTLERLAGLF